MTRVDDAASSRQGGPIASYVEGTSASRLDHPDHGPGGLGEGAGVGDGFGERPRIHVILATTTCSDPNDFEVGRLPVGRNTTWIVMYYDARHDVIVAMLRDDQIASADAAHELLAALEEQLRAAGLVFDLVVVGGSALLALDLVRRTTADVDVVALSQPGGLTSAEELPDGLVAARDRVAQDFGVTDDWLNSGPAELLRFGLPDGFERRWTTQHYGPALTVRWASRLDQIHLKLYAAVDRSGKHVQDLQALDPQPDELMAAALWARRHNPSEGFLSPLREALSYFGVEDVDLGD